MNLDFNPKRPPSTDKTESVVTYWGVEDIQSVYNAFIEAGATENEKPYNVGGDLMTATVKDLWGNVIGFIYNPEFKLK